MLGFILIVGGVAWLALRMDRGRPRTALKYVTRCDCEVLPPPPGFECRKCGELS